MVIKPVYLVHFYGQKEGHYGTCSGIAGIFSNKKLAEKYCEDFKNNGNVGIMSCIGGDILTAYKNIRFSIAPVVIDELVNNDN